MGVTLVGSKWLVLLTLSLVRKRLFVVVFAKMRKNKELVLLALWKNMYQNLIVVVPVFVSEIGLCFACQESNERECDGSEFAFMSLAFLLSGSE